MPAFGNVVINDGQATPVAHTFAPDRIDPKGVAHWFDRSGGIIEGYLHLSHSYRPAQKSQSARHEFSLLLPVLEVSSPSTSTGYQPAPKAAYTPLATLMFYQPARSLLLDRRNQHTYVRNLLGIAAVQSAIENPEAFY